MDETSLLSQFEKWKKEHDQHGRMAFSRFIMLTFLDGLEKVSDDFIFKGGNLLWHYIQTPRATVDLDLSTITLKSHLEIKQCLEQSFAIHKEIQFSIKEFRTIHDEEEIGAAITITYQTYHGQKNQFEIDIVYTLPTDLVKIKSTVSDRSLTSASIENIIADKVNAAHRFAGGNTRMKDFDDLWRISKSDIRINKSKVNRLFKKRVIPFSLEGTWVENLNHAWKGHVKRYKDLPSDILVIFEDINSWLKGLKK